MPSFVHKSRSRKRRRRPWRAPIRCAFSGRPPSDRAAGRVRGKQGGTGGRTVVFGGNPVFIRRDAVFAFGGPSHRRKPCRCGFSPSRLARNSFALYFAHCSTSPRQEFELALLHRLNWDLNSVTSFDFVEQLLSRLALKTNARLIRRHAHTFIALCTTGMYSFSPLRLSCLSQSICPSCSVLCVYGPEELRAQRQQSQLRPAGGTAVSPPPAPPPDARGRQTIVTQSRWELVCTHSWSAGAPNRPISWPLQPMGARRRRSRPMGARRGADVLQCGLCFARGGGSIDRRVRGEGRGGDVLKRAAPARGGDIDW